MSIASIEPRNSLNPGRQPAASRSWLVALLLVASVCSFAPCLTPFAALAVALAATSRVRVALVAMIGMWAINQVVGFGFLGFPHTVESFSWGVVTLMAALSATLIAAVAVRRAPIRAKSLRVAGAFLVAYATYELVLLCAVPFLGGLGAFAPAILGRIAFGNAVWLVTLIVLNELLSAAGRRWLGSMPLIARAS